MAKDGECCKGKWNCVGVFLLILGILELSNPILGIPTIILGCTLINCCGCCGAKCLGCTVAVLGYIFVALDILLAVALYAFLGEMACFSVPNLPESAVTALRVARDTGAWEAGCQVARSNASPLIQQSYGQWCDFCDFMWGTLPTVLLASTVLVTLPIPVRPLRDTSLPAAARTLFCTFIASFVCVCLRADPRHRHLLQVQGARRTLFHLLWSRDDERCQCSQCVTRPHLDAL